MRFAHHIENQRRSSHRKRLTVRRLTVRKGTLKCTVPNKVLGSSRTGFFFFRSKISLSEISLFWRKMCIAQSKNSKKKVKFYFLGFFSPDFFSPRSKIFFFCILKKKFPRPPHTHTQYILFFFIHIQLSVWISHPRTAKFTQNINILNVVKKIKRGIYC